MHKQTDYNKNTETYAQKASDRPTDRFRQKQGSCRKKTILKETVRTVCTLTQTWDLEKD